MAVAARSAVATCPCLGSQSPPAWQATVACVWGDHGIVLETRQPKTARSGVGGGGTAVNQPAWIRDARVDLDAAFAAVTCA
ncbi:hypothetical protein K3495_g727 [Podosphaera aphanis]|nr:hypothetical protein K3495_g727 [Podosphaera aphanis]